MESDLKIYSIKINEVIYTVLYDANNDFNENIIKKAITKYHSKISTPKNTTFILNGKTLKNLGVNLDGEVLKSLKTLEINTTSSLLEELSGKN